MTTGPRSLGRGAPRAGGRRTGSGALGPSLRSPQAPTFGRVRGRAPGGRGGFQQDPEENSFGPEAALAGELVPGGGPGERRTRECGAVAQVPRGDPGARGPSRGRVPFAPGRESLLADSGVGTPSCPSRGGTQPDPRGCHGLPPLAGEGTALLRACLTLKPWQHEGPEVQREQAMNRDERKADLLCAWCFPLPCHCYSPSGSCVLSLSQQWGN